MAIFGKPNSFIGLDIGTSTTKLVEIVDRRKRAELTAYASAQSPNLLTQESVSEKEAIKKHTTVIKRLIDEARISADDVVISLPSSEVFSTVVRLPKTAADQLDQVVRFNAKDVIPTDLKDVVLSWQVIKDATNDESGMSVFITAAPKPIVSRYTQLIEKLDLNLHALEVETLAIARTMSSEGTSAVVDIGSRVSTLHIFTNNQPVVSHTVDYGGTHTTAAIASHLDISFQEAESQKQKFGLTSEAHADTQKAIMESLQPLIKKIDTVVQNHRTPVDQVSLIGGGAKLKGLAEHWVRVTQQGVVIGNPWQGLSLPPQVSESVYKNKVEYAIAIGLAARGIGQV